jgi:tRNA pseudouridine38-40 synthase
MLIPPKPGSGLATILAAHNATYSPSPSSSPVSGDTHPFWAAAPPEETAEAELVRKRTWRVGEEQVTLLREMAARYEKSHNFHNFTVGRDFGDRSNQRFMKKLEVR